MMSEQQQRDEVDRVAREWIGTPYHDHGEVKGRKGGVDCAKLLKCVFVEAGVMDEFKIDHYAPQFFLHQHEELYLSYVIERSREITEGQARYGDMVLYKIGNVYAHGAIILKPGWPDIVHAHYAYGKVIRGSGLAVHLGTPVLGRRFFSAWGR